MVDKLYEPLHPGEILAEDFIEGFELTADSLASAIGVPSARIGEIVNGTHGITADIAIRLARYFGVSEEFWMNLQSRYELEVARGQIGEEIQAIRPIHPLAADR